MPSPTTQTPTAPPTAAAPPSSPAPSTVGAKFAQDVAALVRARNPLLWVVTREEARAERLIQDAAAGAGYEPLSWDCVAGFRDLAGREAGPGPVTDPVAALRQIEAMPRRAVVILRDFAAFSDPYAIRALRNLARALPSAPRDRARSVIVLTPRSEVPPELAGHAIVLDLPLPDRAEIGALLDSVLDAQPDDIKKTAANGARDACVDAAVGLGEAEARSMFARSIVSLRKVDPATVAQEKRRAIAASKSLTWIEPHPLGLEAVGGLENLKEFLRARADAFSARARAYGLPAPKGVVLVGVPGCGKSLTARAIATAWGMILLKFDPGASKSKYVGESEGSFRAALKIAAAVAPCVLWIDEIEKAFQGATTASADGGVSADAMGTFLSFLQDRDAPVFIVATANDVSALPPELLRAGRFDAVFSVDLPDLTERAAIVRAAMKEHRRRESIDAEKIARITDGFSGAEIAALIPAALYAGFSDGARPISTEDLARAAAATVPLSKTAPEKIAAVRAWAKDRARPASRAQDTTTGAGALDL